MDIDHIDYTDPSLATDPYRHLDYLAAHQPVYREPRHGVVMVTGPRRRSRCCATELFSSATLSSARTRVPSSRPAGRGRHHRVRRRASRVPAAERPDRLRRPAHPRRPAGAADRADRRASKENRSSSGGSPTASSTTSWHSARRPSTRLRPPLHPAGHRRPARGPRGGPATLLASPRNGQMPGTGRARHRPATGRATAGHNTLEIFYDYFSEQSPNAATAAGRRADRHHRHCSQTAPARSRSRSPDHVEAVRGRADTAVRLIGTALRRIAEEPRTRPSCGPTAT